VLARFGGQDARPTKAKGEILGGSEINLPYIAPNPLRGVASSFAEASEDKS